MFSLKFVLWAAKTRLYRKQNDRPTRNKTTVPGRRGRPQSLSSDGRPRSCRSLKERPHRHGELRRHVGSMSQRMLTRTLRNLESTGLILRCVTRSKPIAVEYSLRKCGRTIIAPLRGMRRWAKRHRKDVSADIYFRARQPTTTKGPRYTCVPNCAWLATPGI